MSIISRIYCAHCEGIIDKHWTGQGYCTCPQPETKEAGQFTPELIANLTYRNFQLESAIKKLLDGWEHPDNVGEMWIPDFCGEAIEELKQLTNWHPHKEDSRSK